MQKTCKNCQSRTLGCHGRCPTYQAYRAENIRRSQARNDYERVIRFNPRLALRAMKQKKKI